MVQFAFELAAASCPRTEMPRAISRYSLVNAPRITRALALVLFSMLIKFWVQQNIALESWPVIKNAFAHIELF